MFIREPDTSPQVEQLYAAGAKSQGFVMNLSRAWAWRPDVYDGFAALRAQLTGAGTLSKRDQAVIVCAAAAAREDAYCALAWGRMLVQEAGADGTVAVIAGRESAALTARDAALAAWSRKVASNPNGTTAQDVEALRSAGFSEREIFEATVFIAFRMAFSTVNAALGVSPDGELVEALPLDVVEAVKFGRPPAAKTAGH